MRTSLIRAALFGALGLLAGCSSRATPPNMQHQGGAQHGAGQSAAGAAGSAPRPPRMQGNAAVPCTPELDPESEFYVPCRDAGEPPAPAGGGGRSGSAGSPEPPRDAQVPAPDGGEPSPVDSGPMEVDTGTPDEVLCPGDRRTCEQASIETTAADVDCSLRDDVLHVAARVCETCGIAGRLLQFWVMASYCDSCADGSSIGYPGNYWFEANACRDFELDLDLSTWVTNNPCIDVYPRFDNAGSDMITDAAYKIRTCRCDRERGTCVQCVGDVCTPAP